MLNSYTFCVILIGSSFEGKFLNVGYLPGSRELKYLVKINRLNSSV